MPSWNVSNFRILAILILASALIGLINIPLSANGANPPLSYDNTAFVNTSITYYNINGDISGNFVLYPTSNLTPSQWYFSNASANTLINLGDFRYLERTSIGYNQSEGLDLGIQYYINTSDQHGDFTGGYSGAGVYLIVNNI